jgi:hypothetical protein
MASVVVLLYVEHVDCVSNAVCLIYIFGVIEQIWVLMDQPLVAFEMYIVDLVDQNTRTRSEPKEKLYHATILMWDISKLYNNSIYSSIVSQPPNLSGPEISTSIALTSH